MPALPRLDGARILLAEEAAALQPVRRAVDEIEYDAALVCLAGLAAQLGLDCGPDLRMEDSR